MKTTRNALLCWAMLILAVPAAADSPTRIVLFFADDLGYGETGCQGNPEIPTPQIDSLAADGIRFTQGYVCAAYCSPSRAGLISGRIPARFGYHTNVMPHDPDGTEEGLSTDEWTLAESLQRAGLKTGLIGKWHLGAGPRHHPFRHGFDHFFGFAHEGRFFVPPPYQGTTTMLRKKPLPAGSVDHRWYSADGKLIYHDLLGNEPDYDLNNPILRGEQTVEETRDLTTAFTEEAIDFLDQHHEQSFFLMVSWNAVHSPLQGVDAWVDRFAHIPDVQRRIFAAMLAQMDDGMGRILQRLDAHGIADDTLVIFLSDNGSPTKELTSSNAPLRGGKGQYYEGGIRIPFLMRWPNRLPAGQVFSHPVTALDLYASAAGLVADQQALERSDGRDLLPYLTGDQRGPVHDDLFWCWRDNGAYRRGDWKLVQTRGNWEMFHLGRDPAETTDLRSTQPDQFAQLQQQWQSYRNQMPAWPQ